MSFKKVFFQNIFISGSYNFLAQLTSFLASFITSRLLLPEDFGLVGLITVFSGFISVFSDSGITMAVIRSEYGNTYYRGLHSVSILIGVLLCICFLLLIYPISVFYNNSALVLPGIAISFLFILRAINIVPNAILQKRLFFGLSGKAIFLGALGGVLSTILLAYLGCKYWSLIWSQYISTLITSAVLFSNGSFVKLTLKRKVTVKSFYLAKSLIGRLTGFNFINYWARNADNLIVGKYYSTNDLGIYNRAYLMLLMPLTLIGSIFSMVMYPSLIKLKSEGGNVEYEYYFMLKIIAAISIPVSLLLIIFPEAFVQVLWGNNWLEVAKLLPYFGLLILTQPLTFTLSSILVIYDLEKELLVVGWISSGIMVGGIILGATISLTSIAAFYSLSYIIAALPIYIFYLFNYKIPRTKNVLNFWLPKLILSIAIWIGIFYSVAGLVYSSLLIFSCIVFWDIRNEVPAIISGNGLKSLIRGSNK